MASLRHLYERLRSGWNAEARLVHGLWAAVLGLLVRCAVVVWAAPRFPPADDGSFYQVFAERLARGEGYTWLWPDGVVTHAAHYPVGYPGLLSLLYRVFGTSPAVAMAANAVIGALGVLAVHRIARSVTHAGPALFAGVVAALHPSLVGYTPALMTEGVTAALLAILGAAAVILAERPRPLAGLIGLGLGAGLLVLVRPQALLVVPVFGALALSRDSGRARAAGALGVTVLALLVCLPWTLRNCARMDRCVLVSANGGWNLFIGSAEGATGTFVPLEQLGVPEECRTVYGEADKDRCFGQAGLRNVIEHPGHYLSLIPSKLLNTFDWSGAPGHYLRASNPEAFSERQKLALGISEAVTERWVVLLAVVGLGRSAGPNRRLRIALAVFAVPLLFMQAAWIAHLLLVVSVGALGRTLWVRPDAALAGAAVLATALTHAVFFGAGRYGLVCVALLAALSAAMFAPKAGTRAVSGPRTASAGF
jgi:4-amino-4-deoxy-L-arabinose transferase-like glycosyltransferase